MEGRSQRNGRTIRVQREFECSRLEQAMLAEAYRRVLPNDRVRLVERPNGTVDSCQHESLSGWQDDTHLSRDYVTAMGGPLS
jgi:hypothetical protein